MPKDGVEVYMITENDYMNAAEKTLMDENILKVFEANNILFSFAVALLVDMKVNLFEGAK